MGKKIVVLIGVSGSGKSTLAKVMYDSDPKNSLIVNRNKIRELLFGYTESTIGSYYNHPDLYEFEKEITKYEDILIKQGLQDGKTVIVDDTHLKLKYLDRFKDFNVQVDYIPIDTDLELCKQRDIRRVRQVGSKMIERQYKQLRDLYKSTDFKSYYPEFDSHD